MEAYKFKTRVSDDGIIIVPEGFDVKNKVVEVTIVDEVVSDVPKKSMRSFLETYSGILKDVDPDQAKWDYLKEKHNL